MAVTKTQPPDVINSAISAGLVLIGENRVQEYREKREALLPHTLHFIGHLQRNKVKLVLPFAEMIESVDSVSLAQEVERVSAQWKRRTDILVEVNTSGENTKQGVHPEDAQALVQTLQALPHVRVCGLMTVAAPVADPEQVRPSFHMLRSLRDEIAARLSLESFVHLSMGMSDDYPVAIEEGATMIRLGSALFGPRT